jgi:hypothetical protein
LTNDELNARTLVSFQDKNSSQNSAIKRMDKDVPMEKNIEEVEMETNVRRKK